MKLGRRGFFSFTIGGMIAAVVAPFVSRAVAASPGISFEIDEYVPDGTYGGIERSTYSFWRNKPPSPPINEDVLRALFDKCKRGSIME